MSKERVPEGYKQTEVGIIPEDWDVYSLGDVTEYIKGFAFKSSSFITHDGVRVIRVSDTTFDSIKDKDKIFIDREKAKSLKKWFMKEGDLIISTVGSKPPMYDSMVGKATLVDARNENSLLNQNAVIVRSKDWSKENQIFLHNHLKQDRYLDHIEKIFRGNANQASITLKELFTFLIPSPAVAAEKESIASTLSDIDNLLASLDRLIAKKRDLKQATMQQLLTGKKRLPGFVGQWEDKTFQDVITKFSSGSTPTRSRPDFFDGDVVWIAGGELNYQIITQSREKLTEEAIQKSNLQKYPPGTFLMAITGLEAEKTRGSCGITGVEATMNQQCMALIPNATLSTNYLFYYYASVGKRLALEYCQGTKQQSYSSRVVKVLPIKVPPTIEEQDAIVQVLTDMDTELTTLQTRRTKTQALKQAMMQQLLTGKTRLLPPTAQND